MKKRVKWEYVCRCISIGLIALSVLYVLAWNMLGDPDGWWSQTVFTSSKMVIAMVFIPCLLIAPLIFIEKRQTPAEHPLTSSPYYLRFYDACPLLGAVAAGLMHVGREPAEMMFSAALGGLWATGLVWIFIDPILIACEHFLPFSKKIRRKRREIVKQRKSQESEFKQGIITRVKEMDILIRMQWYEHLKPYADELADLVMDPTLSPQQKEARAVDIGLHVYRLGGIACMKYLYDMACEVCETRHEQKAYLTEYVAFWWHGIGQWRSFEKAYAIMEA